MGDFNAIRNQSERLGGSSNMGWYYGHIGYMYSRSGSR